MAIQSNQYKYELTCELKQITFEDFMRAFDACKLEYINEVNIFNPINFSYREAEIIIDWLEDDEFFNQDKKMKNKIIYKLFYVHYM